MTGTEPGSTIAREAPIPPHATTTSAVDVRIDGTRYSAAAGDTVLDVLRRSGRSLPAPCYHPALPASGRCRVCIVHVEESDGDRGDDGDDVRLACEERVRDGMRVAVGTAALLARRREASARWTEGRATRGAAAPITGSRDAEAGDVGDGARRPAPSPAQPDREIGGGLRLRDDRCTRCGLCAAYEDTVSGARGLDAPPDRPPSPARAGVDHALAGGLVDVCPTGAILPADLAALASVARAGERRASFCTECARGCPTTWHVRRGRVAWIDGPEAMPSGAPWICDAGRRARYGWTRPEDRVRTRADAPTALAALLTRAVDELGPERITFLASSWMTLESLALLVELSDALGVPRARIAARARPSSGAAAYPGLRISSDRNPNRRGVERLIGPEAFAASRALAAESGSAIVAFVDTPSVPLEPEWVAALGRSPLGAAWVLVEDHRLPEAVLRLPATLPPERDGTALSEDGVIRRLTPALVPPRGVYAEADILEDTLAAIGAAPRARGAVARFERVRRALPELDGVSLADIDAAGLAIEGS